jgi:hypothetical protein
MSRAVCGDHGIIDMSRSTRIARRGTEIVRGVNLRNINTEQVAVPRRGSASASAVRRDDSAGLRARPRQRSSPQLTCAAAAAVCGGSKPAYLLHMGTAFFVLVSMVIILVIVAMLVAARPKGVDRWSAAGRDGGSGGREIDRGHARRPGTTAEAKCLRNGRGTDE